MNKLPTEILHNIFIYLPIVQKPECMFVCRQWADIIRSRSLFNTIHINSMMAFNRLLKLVEQEPRIGCQVENMILFQCIDQSFNTKDLFLRFPNLKKIRLIKSPENKTRTPTLNTIHQEEELCYLTPTIKNYRIQSIDEFDEFELLRLLITRDFCFHLVTLNLNGYNVFTSPSYIFRLLKAMPSLKNLNVIGFDIAMDDCEMIHANLPSLASLKLDQVDLLPCVIPKNITPATSITRLELIPNFKRTQAVNSGWLKYICKKYTNLRHFNYRLCTFYQYLELVDVYQIQIPLILQQCGTQLSSLSLNCTLDLDLKVIKSLDDNTCRISTLEMDIGKGIHVFDALTKTNQAHYINTLTLSHMLPKVKLTGLKRLTHLKSLTLNYTKFEDFIYGEVDYGEVGDQTEIKRGHVNFIELLNALPASLASLDIRHTRLYLYTTIIQPNQIKNWHLEDIKLVYERKLDDFISTYLPHLTSLALIGINNLDKEFMIPGHQLASLELSPARSLVHDTHHHVCLITKDTPYPRCYSQCDGMSKVYSDLSNCLLPQSLDELGGDTFLTVACGSVKRFVFCGKEAHLVTDKNKFKSLSSDV